MARKAKLSKKSKSPPARSNAGRKRLESKDLRAQINIAVERQIADVVPKLVANMIRLANGGYKRVEREYVPAPRPDAERPADAEPQMVLSKQKESTAEPDRYANQYLIDRLLGRTRQSIEILDSGTGEPKRIVIPDADDRPEPDPQSGHPAQAGA